MNALIFVSFTASLVSPLKIEQADEELIPGYIMTFNISNFKSLKRKRLVN